MKSAVVRLFVLLVFVGLFSMAAYADLNSVIVNRGGLEWVWASPCAPEQPSCGATLDLTLNGGGWSLPTQQQWLDSFADRLDLYNAFNPESGQLCASGYWNSGYSHCDASDLFNGHIWHSAFCDPNYFNGCEASTTEAFLVRSAGPAVPEPNTLALLSTALAGGIGVFRRRIF